MVAPPLHDVINAPVKHIALQLVFYAVPRAPVCHPKDLFGSRQDGPIPTLLASVSKTKGCPYSGKAKTSAMTKHCRKCVKAFWQSSVHSKGVFFCHQMLRLYVTWLQQNASMQLKFALVMPKY